MGDVDVDVDGCGALEIPMNELLPQQALNLPYPSLQLFLVYMHSSITIWLQESIRSIVQ
jgi:hypothetical protein